MSEKKEFKTFVTPHLVCPFCGHKMDRSTEAQDSGDDAAPRPGDVSLCIRCGKAAVFADKGLRKPTGEEMLQFATNNTITETQIFLASLPRKPS